MKERAGPIPLRGVNGVKYHVRRHVYPLQKRSCLYEYFAKEVLILDLALFSVDNRILMKFDMKF
jgi:hypothetical protein